MFIPKVISSYFLSKKELGKPQKSEVIVLQKTTVENKFARDLNNDLVISSSVLLHWNEL